MRYFSLFSGIGGFELGIQQAYEDLRPLQQGVSKRPKKQHDTSDELVQWECVGHSEIDKYAIQIYERHFNHKNYGDCNRDIDKIKTSSINKMMNVFAMKLVIVLIIINQLLNIQS